MKQNEKGFLFEIFHIPGALFIFAELLICFKRAAVTDQTPSDPFLANPGSAASWVRARMPLSSLFAQQSHTSHDADFAVPSYMYGVVEKYEPLSSVFNAPSGTCVAYGWRRPPLQCKFGKSWRGRRPTHLPPSGHITTTI